MATQSKSGADPAAPDARVDLTHKPDSNAAAPTLPNERDEAVGMTGGVPSETVQQGHRDLKRGVEDTSRGAEAERAYKKQQ